MGSRRLGRSLTAYDVAVLDRNGGSVNLLVVLRWALVPSHCVIVYVSLTEKMYASYILYLFLLNSSRIFLLNSSLTLGDENISLMSMFAVSFSELALISFIFRV